MPLSQSATCYNDAVIAPKTPTVRPRLPLVGGLLGIASVLALAARRLRRRRRPTAEEVMLMDARSFEKFVRSTGLKSASDFGDAEA